MQPLVFQAPWSRKLKWATGFSAGFLLILLFSGLLTLLSDTPSWFTTTVLILIPAGILFGTLPFVVRGYVLTDKEIQVRRLGFVTHLPLDGLQSLSGDAEAMRGSLRLLGNGGLFSFTGEFWNRRLGRYRALATDPDRAVVLKYADRTVVITPHDPQQLIVRARTLLKQR
jgi:hypothetical protein